VSGGQDMKVTDKRIGVIMGGKSAEREVSLRSGNAIYNALHNAGYDVRSLDAGDDLPFMIKKENIEIAFLTLHGGLGENGAVQGLLEVMGIPYTGSGVLASALAMDKVMSKKIFTFHNLPVPPFTVLTEKNRSCEKILFPLPWVIKPSTEGSSVGITIVKNMKECTDALNHAFSYGNQVLVEKYIKGQEVQVGIVGSLVLGAIEVKPKEEFYNYVAKYSSGLTEYIIPPEIDEETLHKAGKIALEAHTALNCSGATRGDFIIDRDDVYILEVNTLAGMTETSLLPKIAAHYGMSFKKLIEEILRIAIEKPTT
jgi:D-alanine-D-alanine ligase